MCPREFERVLHLGVKGSDSHFRKDIRFYYLLRAEVRKNIFPFQQEGIPNKEDIS